jgi:hypothetical protein
MPREKRIYGSQRVRGASGTPLPRRRSPHADHPAVTRLIEFITAMNAWERAVIARNFKRMDDLFTRGRKLVAQLADIYATFCEPGAQPERLTEANWGLDEPDYDAAAEGITRVTPGRAKVLVETLTAKYNLKMRYELVNRGGHWCLRGHRQCYDPEVRKWCYCQL